jgi:hypothetical protein
MAETKITDIIIPEIYSPYVIAESIYINAFFRSGVAVPNVEITKKLIGGGEVFNFPFFKELSGDSQIPSETVAVTVKKVDTAKQIAVRQIRVDAFGSNALASILSGENVFDAIVSMNAQYWSTQFNKNVISITVGVMNYEEANNTGDMVKDISTEDGDNATAANLIGSNAVIDTNMLLGDAHEKFGVIAMHSVVYSRLLKLGLIDNNTIVVPSSSTTTTGNVEGKTMSVKTYLGMAVVVDDQLPRDAGGTSGFKYTSFIYERGALLFGESTNNIVNTEIQRDETKGAGIDILHTRRNFSFHPFGYAWQDSSVAGVSPTNAELETAANWARIEELKNLKIVALITNG